MVSKFISDSTLISDWDFDRNVLDPNLTYIGSNKKVWWNAREVTCGKALLHLVLGVAAVLTVPIAASVLKTV